MGLFFIAVSRSLEAVPGTARPLPGRPMAEPTRPGDQGYYDLISEKSVFFLPVIGLLVKGLSPTAVPCLEKGLSCKYINMMSQLTIKEEKHAQCVKFIIVKRK